MGAAQTLLDSGAHISQILAGVLKIDKPRILRRVLGYTATARWFFEYGMDHTTGE